MDSTFFISHGTPMMLADDTIHARHFLRLWKKKVLPSPPKAILIISAHWDTPFPTVNTVSINDTIYDFPHPNFPEATYKFKYPAPGSPELAKKVKELLLESGYDRVDEDGERGLDHGAWIPPVHVP
ncbi:hypothetical protein MLD38_005059 [Melastoma candidum]|uniref:Uncharacterized protein n=1 Tax=Melastoma candidum TaxID=119954 RepID=A0ACB9S766_9MYRT|nr:hypothetical protein MLD38_005059 [Melastoma candidum]